ncbi:hypothetical protein CEXT_725621 [Caerostris extrusa]|uniref:Uncharacterized protein n=1 Tax=Caerostris extrusa TaxID=172846 RepID=A0AAV4X732_CAEEX|nr:hypothetical protein CEXT_725621 [Caerostris extrusa]
MRDSMDEESGSLPNNEEPKGGRKPSTHRPLTPTISEEVEELIEQSIEIESNKKMERSPVMVQPHLQIFWTQRPRGSGTIKVNDSSVGCIERTFNKD